MHRKITVAPSSHLLQQRPVGCRGLPNGRFITWQRRRPNSTYSVNVTLSYDGRRKASEAQIEHGELPDSGGWTYS